MNTDGNLEALRRYDREQDKKELMAEQAIKEFRDAMDEAVDHIVSSFNYNAKHNIINRNELREILMEDLDNAL
jgi:hypothetical protein